MKIQAHTGQSSLAYTITQLAHSVGCDVVAEGIKNSAQAAYLSSIGCAAAACRRICGTAHRMEAASFDYSHGGR